VLFRALLMPPASLLMVAAAGLWLAVRGRRAGLPIALAGVVATWFFCTYLVAYSLVGWVESGQHPFDRTVWETSRAGTPPPGAIVVLGGGSVVDGPHSPRRERLTPWSMQRVLAGARVARMTGLPVLVSGGGAPGGGQQSEASLMRAMLEEELSVPVRWVEDRSRDTAENAVLSAAILKDGGIGSIVLVTHAFHMPRARAAFEAVGLVVYPAPHDWLSGPAGPQSLRALWPTAQAGALSSLALREFLGRAWYGLIAAN
jgi:uncharacterized SAM-binding protein YcdF (DUF218 family)